VEVADLVVVAPDQLQIRVAYELGGSPDANGGTRGGYGCWLNLLTGGISFVC
jgi:hypothetical protein